VMAIICFRIYVGHVQHRGANSVPIFVGSALGFLRFPLFLVRSQPQWMILSWMRAMESRPFDCILTSERQLISGPAVRKAAMISSKHSGWNRRDESA